MGMWSIKDGDCRLGKGISSMLGMAVARCISSSRTYVGKCRWLARSLSDQVKADAEAVAGVCALPTLVGLSSGEFR